MSAFVVGETTMHNVVRLIMKGGLVRNFAGFNTEQGPARHADEIGRALFKMNVNAVEQRYPDCVGHPGNLPGTVNAGELPTVYRFNDKWTPITKKERIIAHKAATCLRYQCSEGNIPETALYGELQALIAANAEQIVSNLPEYDAAPWD